MWTAILEAAKEWGMPPWAIEEQATEEWWERWRMMREETTAYQANRSKPHGGGEAVDDGRV